MRVRAMARALGMAVAALLTALILGIALFYFAFSIPEPEGRSLATWPATFTDNFSIWMHEENGSVTVEDIGLNRLDEYGLWLQVIDAYGEEVYRRNAPSDLRAHYNAADLAHLSEAPFDGQYSKFVGYADVLNGGCYIVGFPYPIGKGTIYYNGDSFSRMNSVAIIAVSIFAALLILGIAAYSLWLTARLRTAVAGIESVSRRTYRTKEPRGIFAPVVEALNQLDSDLRASDESIRATERMRREWVENVTHDLRTPLSPIRGYAELLVQGNPQRQDIRESGQIVLRNVERIDGLLADLKLAYEIDGGTYPVRKERIQLERAVRESVIDIMNAHPNRGDSISYSSNTSAIVEADIALLSRAFGNIVQNALDHNPPGTRVHVLVHSEQGRWAIVEVADDGDGVSPEELPRLFDRHWRSIGDSDKHNGSGLGLSIAKEVVELHGGTIKAESTIGAGTTFIIKLPSTMQD